MSGATRPMRISELLGKLPAWCRQAARQVDQRSPASPPAPQTGQDGPIDPENLPLPPALKGRVTALRQGQTLVISAPTSAAAQILRFQAPKLAEAAGLTDCRVRVGASTPAPARAPGTPDSSSPSLPSAAAPMLQELADSCDHKRLEEALRRLAAQATKP